MSFLQAVFAGQELYEVTVDYHGPIVFRLLPYASFLKLQRLLLNHPRTQEAIEDEVWTLCVLEHPYQVELDDVLAGTVSTVANLILFLSGLPDREDKEVLLEFSRQRVNNELMAQLQTIICKAFPAYTPDMLEGLTIHQLMLRVAQAELITEEQLVFEVPEKPKPLKVKPLDFDEEDRKLREMGIGTSPHDTYGLRRR